MSLFSSISSVVSTASSVASTVSSVSSHYNLLSYGANNSTVSAFSELVNNAEAGIQDSASSAMNSAKSAASNAAKSVTGKVSSAVGSVTSTVNSAKSRASSIQSELASALPKKHLSELNQELYDKACNLPEAKTVSLKLLNDASQQKYGHFKGGTVYKTFDGEIDTSNKNVRAQDGWIVIDNSSGLYCLFTNNNKSYIIAIKDFTPQPLVEDFTPLYNKLSEQKYANVEAYSNDLNVSPAVATTFKEETALQINNENIEVNDLVQSDRSITPAAYSKIEYKNELYQRAVNEKSLKQTARNYHGIYPQQVGKGNSINAAKNDSVYNSIQAVIYDLPDGSSADKTGIANSMNQLFCYQQPESVSFTASAGYEAVSPRGSQQPFQFYTGANAMNLSFALKWHIDEVRTFAKTAGKGSFSLQEIAEIAESFTRPWDVENGGSLQPKLCKVILPGISEIGYITQAQVSYSGDMSGSYTKGAGVISGSGTNIEVGSVTDYFYSQLEINFELLMVKDIKLLSACGDRGLKLNIFSEDETITQTEAKETDNKVVEAEQVTDTKNNSASVEAPPGGIYDDVNGMCMPDNSNNLLGYEDEEAGMSVPYSAPTYTSVDGGENSTSSEENASMMSSGG